MKPSKCHLFKEKVACLGHIISWHGIETDPEKISDVKNWPEPTCVGDIQKFMGFGSYNRRFIEWFAEIAVPLHAQLLKQSKFSWSDSCQQAFKVLKEKLLTAPILAFPVPENTFMLDTDASGCGIGGLLSQVINGNEKVLAFASRSLSKCEMN